MRGRALACVFVVAIGGCNLVVDLDGLSGGVDPNVPDSSTAQGDASTAVDTGTDVVVDTGPGRFCGSGPTWCEDFDGTNSVPALDQLDDPSSSLSISSTASSAPHSLQVKYPAGNYTRGSIAKALPAGDKIVASFDIRVNYTFTDGQVVWFILYLPNDSQHTDHYFYVESYGGPLRVLETVTPVNGQAQYAGDDIQTNVVKNQFQHLVLSVDRTRSHYTVDLDGARVADANMMSGFPKDKYSVQLGAFAQGVLNGEATALIDNVSVTVTP